MADQILVRLWAYCEADYKIALQEMKELSNDAHDAFLKQNPKVFCRCYLNTETKTDVVVNNMAETFNGFIIKSRSKHVIDMLEDIRLALMTRLANNKMAMIDKEVSVCPRVQKKLDKAKKIAWRCEVYPSGPTLFQVKAFDDVSVDIANRSCSCRRWDLSGLPCYHVCVVAAFLKLNAEEFAHRYFTKDMYMRAYEYTIPPLPSEKYWPYVHLPLDPPPVRIQPGRPKKNRRKDPHEDPKKPGKLTRHGMSMKCSLCGSKEHNRRTCGMRGKGNEAAVKRKGKEGAVKGKGKQTDEPKRKRGRPSKKDGQPSSQVSTISTQQP